MSQPSATTLPTVAVVVTSCRRIDLLEKTLESFLAHNDYPIQELVVIEDSDHEEVYGVSALLKDVPHRIILNGQNIGQIASIDKAYATVTADYIFHMEDDWGFTEKGFIGRALEVLQQEPRMIIVSVRDDADMPSYVRSLKTLTTAHAAYKRMFPALHHIWYTFTFNPSLKRTADYRALPGGYKGLGEEGGISRHYKAEKCDMGWLIGGGVHHTGHQRSNYGSSWGYNRNKPGSASLSRLLRAENLRKWRESLRRKFWHSLRKAGIDTEPFQRR